MRHSNCNNICYSNFYYLLLLLLLLLFFRELDMEVFQILSFTKLNSPGVVDDEVEFFSFADGDGWMDRDGWMGEGWRDQKNVFFCADGF